MSALPALLCALAILAAQVFYGGLLRPVFALPAFTLVGLAGCLGVVAFFRPGRAQPGLWTVLFGLAFSGWMIWRCSVAPPTAETAGWLRLVLACAVTFFIFAGCSTDSRGRLIFFAILFVAAAIQATLGGYQYIRRVPDMPFDWLSEQLRVWYGARLGGRAHGFFINGNHLAWFLNVVALAAISVTCWARWPSWGRILSGYVAAVAVAGSLVTLSRGGYIGLATGLSVFLFASAVVLIVGAGHHRLAAALALIGGVGVAAISAWMVFSESAVVQQRLSMLTSDVYRPMVFESVARQFQAAPIFGGGPGAFKEAGRVFRGLAVGTDDMFAHNDWAQLAADFGFPALALAFLLAVILASNGLSALAGPLARNMDAQGGVLSNRVAIAFAALCGFASCAAHSFFDFNMQIPANALLAAACAGMLANPGEIASGTKGNLPRTVSGALAAALAIFGGAALIGIVNRDAPGEVTLLQAENALLTGNFDAAIERTASLLERNPADYDARILRGRALLARSASRDYAELRVQDSRRALAEFGAAQSIRPLDALGCIAQAVAFGRARNYAAAEQSAAQAVALFPLYYGGYEILGLALEAQGRDREAARIYSLALALPEASGMRPKLNNLIKKMKVGK